ncbi:hypothetical protein [Nocardia mangyaensis]|uniref:hypothetical protein n=1 Tax=Nocardia mangyaensis TaxID=2213200 RepID=UPI0026746943|nr:hypothetical protein [Nocardia mangyaensis]MDO3648462.1 hypothetical protein [Nocardia mangyaensis]
MATVTRQSGANEVIFRPGFFAAKSTMTPSALVTLGLILLIPVLATAGPIAASALIARNAGVGWPGAVVFAVLAAVVCLSVIASVVAFRMAWRRGRHSFGTFAR